MFESKLSKEKLTRYIYIDHSNKDRVIFECQASNIEEADRKYESKTGHDPRKQNHVGCLIDAPVNSDYIKKHIDKK